MAVDLSGLSQTANNISALSGVAMVTPELVGYNAQKNNKERDLEKNPMLFHIEDSNSVALDSDITDHVVEDNTVVNDQISTKPETVSVNGFIGELNTVLPRGLQKIREAKEKLILVSGYVPELTITSLRALNAAEQAYRLSAAIQNQFSSLFEGDALNQNKQQEFYQKWFSYWKNKTLFTVQTPWTLFTDMAIQSFKMNQDGETAQISDVEITFKKIRFAAAVYQTEKELQNRLKYQSSKLQNNGVSSGTDSTVSFRSSYA